MSRILLTLDGVWAILMHTFADAIEDSISAGLVGEGAHGPGASAMLMMPSLLASPRPRGGEAHLIHRQWEPSHSRMALIYHSYRVRHISPERTLTT